MNVIITIIKWFISSIMLLALIFGLLANYGFSTIQSMAPTSINELVKVQLTIDSIVLNKKIPVLKVKENPYTYVLIPSPDHPINFADPTSPLRQGNVVSMDVKEFTSRTSSKEHDKAYIVFGLSSLDGTKLIDAQETIGLFNQEKFAELQNTYGMYLIVIPAGYFVLCILYMIYKKRRKAPAAP
jgi:hypothetical protein